MLLACEGGQMKRISTNNCVNNFATPQDYTRTSRVTRLAKTVRCSFFSLGMGRFLCGVLLFAFVQSVSVAQSKPEEITFTSDGRELHGFIWRPEGAGPFAAVLWNHGSEKLPGSQPILAKFYTAHAYVFFVPHRRGQGRSPGDYIQDLIAQAAPGERAQRLVELQQAEVEDVIAALNYLRSRSFVDPTRIALSGCSYGGIQTLLAGERDLGAKALVPFAPGAMSWEQNVRLQDRLVRAVGRAQAPVFLIQAQNDYSLAPSWVLSREASKKEKPFQSKI
jgi:carboxymethylenebutenolidase